MKKLINFLKEIKNEKYGSSIFFIFKNYKLSFIVEKVRVKKDV